MDHVTLPDPVYTKRRRHAHVMQLTLIPNNLQLMGLQSGKSKLRNGVAGLPELSMHALAVPTLSSQLLQVL